MRMGGSIAVGIRKQDGTEYIGRRWTNPLPGWLSDPAFWEGNEVVDKYIDNVTEDSEDFGTLECIKPESYGIVLIDFQTKRVLNRQGYCGVGSRTCAFIDADDAKHLLDMIERGWVTKYEVWRRGDRTDNELHPDEVQAFHTHLRALSGEPPEEKWVSVKHFEPGMMIVHWQVPEWKFDNEGPEAQQCWSQVQAFVKETGWKTPCVTQEEVDARFHNDAGPDDDEDEEPDSEEATT